jgi:hypothetical protein
MTLEKLWRREPVGSKWRWIWNGWASPAFEELEERGWTPRVIGGHLCFSARENGRWYVVHGDDPGPGFDDAYDTVDYKGLPLFNARNGDDWFLVRGKMRSQSFPVQISFRIEEDGTLGVYTFPRNHRGAAVRLEAVFEPL